jgi:hypothetical protein
MLAITRKAKTIKSMAAIALCAIIFSFAPTGGGEGFQIFLNDKVVLQQYGNAMKTVKNLNLDNAADNDQLSVRYDHCGRAGKSRIIIIKDGNDKVLKQFKFSDVADPAAPMSCKVKNIRILQTGKDKTLKLFYSSAELPEGRLLTSIVTGAKNVAKL